MVGQVKRNLLEFGSHFVFGRLFFFLEFHEYFNCFVFPWHNIDNLVFCSRLFEGLEVNSFPFVSLAPHFGPEIYHSFIFGSPHVFLERARCLRNNL